ncbi:MAG: hypothetical protein WCD57_11910, partial [Acidobacteriaceae bacterium]
SESMPAYAACLVARPPVKWIALDKVCLFMILSLDAKIFCAVMPSPTVPAFPESAREPKLLCGGAVQLSIALNFAATPGSISNRFGPMAR